MHPPAVAAIFSYGQPGPVAVNAASTTASLTKEELKTVAQGCLKFLQSYLQNPLQVLGSGSVHDGDVMFSHFLVTATLCLGLAPRSQILQQLRIGSSFVKGSDGLFWVLIRAEQSKNGKPTMFALASELTSAFDAYLQRVRPRMLGRLPPGAVHDYVFMKRSGAAPRTDFSSSTCLVTQTILGKAVNAHQFRSAVITAFYESGASQSEMDMLANIMAHNPATAKSFYHKPVHTKAAVKASERMVDLLLPQQHRPEATGAALG